MPDDIARITPARLINAFCVPAEAAGFPGAHGERPDTDGRTIARGFCGYNGRYGFDDGYDFLEQLPGWTPLPSKGDWPHVVYVRQTPDERDPKWTIAEYSEGTLTVWRFATRECADAFANDLPAAPHTTAEH
jgi:hypothetical protein